MLGITAQGRALRTFPVAGNAFVFCAKLGWLRAKGRQATCMKECASIPRLFQGVSPSRTEEAAEEDIVQAGSKWGLSVCVGRGINMDRVRLPGSQ